MRKSYGIFVLSTILFCLTMPQRGKLTAQDTPKVEAPVAKKEGVAEPLLKGWKKISLGEGKYSVLFPDTPVYRKAAEETPLGPIQTGQHTGQDKEGNFYMALYTIDEFPNKLADSVRLEGSIDGMLDKTKGKIIGLTKITIKKEGGNKYPGKDAQMRVPNGTYARLRNFIIDDRLVAVLMVGKTEEIITSPQADAFFDSLKILDLDKKPMEK